MGVWGPGLWSDDTAADVRTLYREALEDGLDDDHAQQHVLAQFEQALSDEDEAPVVWLALAAAQSNSGRLSADVRQRAVEVIDSGADLQRWVDADTATISKRRANLVKLRDQLTGEQRPTRRIRKPARPVTTLFPGDVLAFQADSGRLHLLAVRALDDNRYFCAPWVQLLDFADTHLPSREVLADLPVRRKGRAGHGPRRPAEPWHSVQGSVYSRRGHDWADESFQLVAHLDPLPTTQQRELTHAPVQTHMGTWTDLAAYLQREDVGLGQRLEAQRHHEP